MIHELKILPEYFEAVAGGAKSFELRKDDRGFTVGDEIILKEWNGTEYTGRSVKKQISYILKNYTGLAEGYAILSLRD
ncbi:RNA-binding protein [Candidatus Methanomassiliicoccus intestinalis]|uniref:RNA-binding protein n=2 Tax=Candidatus Methanomassiliicoccus intestinalis TaxID=1406512 RepID=A0A8J8PIG5_9ARCH|nr:MAG: RNA-binding protein [Candidatus Methanomassiliicoccus intestinalis]